MKIAAYMLLNQMNEFQKLLFGAKFTLLFVFVEFIDGLGAKSGSNLWYRKESESSTCFGLKSAALLGSLWNIVYFDAYMNLTILFLKDNWMIQGKWVYLNNNYKSFRVNWITLWWESMTTIYLSCHWFSTQPDAVN